MTNAMQGWTPEIQSEIDQKIFKMILPQCYEAINGLLDHVVDAPKDLIVRARGLLPAAYKHSFVKVKK